MMASIFFSLLIIVSLLIVVESIMSDKEMLLDSQPSSIESGFEKLWHSMFISSPFFMLAVLFVLFDMELILLFPCVFAQTKLNSVLMLGVILMVVVMTLLMEWGFSGLKWHI